MNMERFIVITTVDEGKGVVKVYWEQVRERVAKVNPIFAEIVDNLSPDKRFPLYLAYYPYGACLADTKQVYFPQMENNQIITLSEKDTPKEYMKHLGYGQNSVPMGMILEKEFEFFIDLKNEYLTIPWAIYKPGDILPITKLLSNSTDRLYSPNDILVTTSGVRSCFMLPHIGSTEPHGCLKRDFNITASAPKSLYEHWFVFKELANSKVLDDQWRSCVLFFSHKWVEMLHTDPAWIPLQLYLYKSAWHRFEYDRNRTAYDVAFSLIQKKRNLKPNPYLVDTAKHLFATILGAAPGYMPAMSDEGLPLKIINMAYLNSYKLSQYHPIIMQASQYKFEIENSPSYYSLHYPSTYNFSPKSQKGASTLAELRDLKHIMQIFSEELSKNNLKHGTILNKIAGSIECNYFHNKIDQYKVIKNSHELFQLDNKLLSFSEKREPNSLQFPSESPFLRGCISIAKK